MKTIHGGDIYSAMDNLKVEANKVLDFSANINPLGIPYSIKAALADAIEDCMNYPDPHCRKLLEHLARYEDVEQSYIMCGNGAAELIFRVVQATKPKKGLLLAPTFAEYELALESLGAEVVYAYLDEKNGFVPDASILEQIDEHLDILFICNPNNPTGLLMPQEILLQIVHKCQACGVLCVVDECFNDFLKQPDKHTLKDELKKYSCLVLLKAFTKIYAIPGVRLGYCMTSQRGLIERMHAIGQCWSVSTFAQAAGCAALGNEKYLEETARIIEEERSYLTIELALLRFTVYAAQANYIFFKYREEMPLDKLLAQEGILIRNCDNYRGLEKGYYRIAVKQHKQNKALIEAIERVISTWQKH